MPNLCLAAIYVLQGSQSSGTFAPLHVKLGARCSLLQSNTVLQKPHAGLHPLQVGSGSLKPQAFLTRYIHLLPQILNMNHKGLLSVSNVHACPAQIHGCHQHKSFMAECLYPWLQNQLLTQQMCCHIAPGSRHQLLC